MKRGIDVSENNGNIPWNDVWASGVDFAIIRLGYGRRHLDSMFAANIKAAFELGLKVGVYYYSYALTPEAARAEGEFMVEQLREHGIMPSDLAIGCWFDMEDADGYKESHGMPDDDTLTAMCSEFICAMNEAGYGCGIYASLDWLENRIHTNELASYVPYWCAQWGRSCDWPNAKIWQYTDELYIEGHVFDGNLEFEQ